MTSATAPNYWQRMIEAFTKGFQGFMPDELDPLVDPLQEEGLPDMWFDREQPSAQFEPNPIAAQPSTEHISSRRWMAQWDNGKIPASAMAQIPGGDYMRPDAAAAFVDLYEAAKAQGVIINVTDAYRDYNTQVRLAQENGLYGQGGLAAVPGTSQHGWGMAVDISGDGAVRWMQQHGAEYGYETIPREPWHWQYTGGYTSPDTTAQVERVRRGQPRAGSPGQRTAQVVMKQGNPDAFLDGLFAAYQDEAARKHGRTPRYVTDGDQGPGGGVKRQLWQGFMDAGRKDLARMVYTKDFDTWIKAESGWKVDSVSQPYTVNGISGVNGGLFQIRYPAHPWAHQYFSQGNSPASTFTASAYEQAMLIAQHFRLTPDMIREYARQVRSGGYHGWP